MSEKLTYHWEGDYLIPDLLPPESPSIGIWGERRRRFLRSHQRSVYDAMMMNGTLNAHLEEVDRSAEAMLDRLMEQMAKREKITEKLKSENQMLWIQKMTTFQNQASEIIYHDLICV
ncbi:MAG: TnpV protein [Oscillospiraceae bacterium]|jgi:hypothetical protein|nr:TnpV protein [Oscillospiraceae bacterium]